MGGLRQRGDSEGALGRAWRRDRTRDMILATRYGFHGKKGLAGAVTGSETDHERDPRVRFISFPMTECVDVSHARASRSTWRRIASELDALLAAVRPAASACLITEPYLGGGGSYHPPKEYLQLLQAFCREHDIVFILDEVQSNFGRTGDLFAFETYGLEPDIVVLGKGLGNGVPVGGGGRPGRPVRQPRLRRRLRHLERQPALLRRRAGHARRVRRAATCSATCRRSSAVIEEGLVRLKELPFVAHVRGEKGGMVWGVEMRDHAGRTAAEWANAVVLACYRGDGERRHPPARAAGEEGGPHRAAAGHHRSRSSARRWN